MVRRQGKVGFRTIFGGLDIPGDLTAGVTVTG